MVPATAAHTIEGVFNGSTPQPVLRTITVVSADSTMGTVSGSCQAYDGDTIVISATAVSNSYLFDHWNDNVTDNPRTVVVNGDATYTAYFKPVDGIDDVEMNASISLYPNPAISSVTIDGLPIGATISVVDQQGRTTLQTTSTDTAQTLDVSQWPRGTYFVRISNNGSTAVRKLLVR